MDSGIVKITSNTLVLEFSFGLLAFSYILLVLTSFTLLSACLFVCFVLYFFYLRPLFQFHSCILFLFLHISFFLFFLFFFCLIDLISFLISYILCIPHFFIMHFSIVDWFLSCIRVFFDFCWNYFLFSIAFYFLFLALSHYFLPSIKWLGYSYLYCNNIYRTINIITSIK